MKYDPNYQYSKGKPTKEDREHFLLNQPEIDACLDRIMAAARKKGLINEKNGFVKTGW